LVPGASLTRKVKIKVPPANQADQDSEYVLFSQVETEGQSGYIEEFIYSDIIRCAYDPNDKLVNPKRDDNLSLIREDLIYTIRFQNVGNYHAEYVRIEDTLDNNLDISTFQLLASSHREVLLITMDDHVVHFNFDGIFLPDSTTNLEGSNGYVMYSIAADSTILENTEINNTAHIYFDFNEAIVTNTTQNIMVSEFPIVDAVDEENLLLVDVFPNPSGSIFYFSELVDQITVSDIQGRQIVTERNSRHVDLEHYHAGLYFAKIEKGEKYGIVKLVLTK